MSVSEDQAVEAAVFLTLYKEAIETLEYVSQQLGNQHSATPATRPSTPSPIESSGFRATGSSAEYLFCD